MYTVWDIPACSRSERYLWHRDLLRWQHCHTCRNTPPRPQAARPGPARYNGFLAAGSHTCLECTATTDRQKDNTSLTSKTHQQKQQHPAMTRPAWKPCQSHWQCCLDRHLWRDVPQCSHASDRVNECSVKTRFSFRSSVIMRWLWTFENFCPLSIVMIDNFLQARRC